MDAKSDHPGLDAQMAQMSKGLDTALAGIRRKTAMRQAAKVTEERPVTVTDSGPVPLASSPAPAPAAREGAGDTAKRLMDGALAGLERATQALTGKKGSTKTIRAKSE